MQRVDNMAERLPQLYRGGELLRGTQRDGGVLGVPAVQIEVADEVAREVQRTHWFDATYELEHAAKIAALLDFVPEAWQDLDIFRGWVHAIRDALLREGGVTVRGIETFVREYTTAFNDARRFDVFAQMQVWNDADKAAKAKINSAPALIENPAAVRIARLPEPGEPEPLQQFVVTNGGRDAATLSFLLAGTTRGAEAAPLLANITTGDALIYLGEVPEGKRLWIRGTETGATARLENEDVTSKLRSVSGLVPGKPVTTDQLTTPPAALPLVRGANQLWFFPIAFYDLPGLDRYLFSMPDLSMTDGRFDTTAFDHGLFHQMPLIVLHAAWTERTPASFEVRLPAAFLGTRPSGHDAVEHRERLLSSVAEGVGELRAAGVDAAVSLEALADIQPQRDRLRLVMPVNLQDRAPMGADRRTENAGAFEVTPFDDSTFR
jgi:hypothetical protein